MDIDPANKIVQLCSEGMNAEFEGKLKESEALFKQAWELANDDFEAFIAAHYMARRQQSLEEKLKWNLEAYNLANKINDAGIKKYLPSLCLNVGKSYEDMGQTEKAILYYQSGAHYADSLNGNPYGDMIKSGLSEGLKRMGVSRIQYTILDDLIDKWCERRELKPLSFVLASYLNNLGTDLDKGKLVSSLSHLSAARCVNEEDQQLVEKLIIDLQI